MAGPPYGAFTNTSNHGLQNILRSNCGICAAFDPLAPQTQPHKYENFSAIWDTGATNSAITQEVVNRCGLKPTGMVRVQTAQGVKDTETFVVNMALPNGVGFANITVSLGALGPGSDVLIGMDIMVRGDFAVSNTGGVTVFSFRVPSVKTIDFVKEWRDAQQPPRPFDKYFRKTRKPWRP